MNDTIDLKEIFEYKSGSISSLGYVPVGEVWTRGEIEARKYNLFFKGREWTAVDNLIVHEGIKTGAGAAECFIDSYKQTLINLSAAGIRLVRYNFSPIFYKLSTHSACSIAGKYQFSGFDPIAFAVFDNYILKREGAEMCYNDYQLHVAKLFNRRLSYIQKKQLEVNILQCVQDKRLTVHENLCAMINRYKSVSDEMMKNNLKMFRKEILPLAQELRIEMAFEKNDLSENVFNLPSACYN